MEDGIINFEEKRVEKKWGQIKESMNNSMEKYGWIAHMVFAEDGVHANYHTHGVRNHFNHKDFQISLNLNTQIAHGVLTNVVELVKKGNRFEEGIRYSNVIYNYDVEFKIFTEDGREVYRILLPDKNGYLPTEDGCSELYKSQLDYF